MLGQARRRRHLLILADGAHRLRFAHPPSLLTPPYGRRGTTSFDVMICTTSPR